MLSRQDDGMAKIEFQVPSRPIYQRELIAVRIPSHQTLDHYGISDINHPNTAGSGQVILHSF